MARATRSEGYKSRSKGYKILYIGPKPNARVTFMNERGIVERREGVWYWVTPDFKNPHLPGDRLYMEEWEVLARAQ